jgi:hypothetical protein
MPGQPIAPPSLSSPSSAPSRAALTSQFDMYYPPGYDPRRAHELAALVNEAYGTCERAGSNVPASVHLEGYRYIKSISGGYKPSFRDWFMLLVFTVRARRFPVNRPYFGFVARHGDDVVLVFRGTDSEDDVLSDLHMGQVLFYDHLRRRKPAPSTEFEPESAAEAEATERWKDARLEQGVWDIYRSLRDQVVDAVDSCWAPGRRLFVTGHSLGAVLAIAAVPDLIRNTRFRGDQRPLLYTFAGPRAVNREFALAMRQEQITCYRVVHTEDIVPTAPGPIPARWLEWLMHGMWYYAHVGTPVAFTLVQEPGAVGTYGMNHELTTYMGVLQEQAMAEATRAGREPQGRTAELTSP